jgi:hypothetical protein
MRCDKCGRNMVKVDRREEMTDLDDDATDGQIADFFATEMSGDAGAWSVGVIEYHCAHCDAYHQIQEDELTNYKSLIVGWHEKAAVEGDYFSRFVFEYLAFIAHLKNNVYFGETRDRNVIQNLKQDFRRQDLYVQSVQSNDDLLKVFEALIRELQRSPLRNSSMDLDYPEIDKWWNCSGRKPLDNDPGQGGVIRTPDDWENTIEFWYSVRNNLFHGGKSPNIQRDLFLVEHAYKTLAVFMKSEIDALA